MTKTEQIITLIVFILMMLVMTVVLLIPMTLYFILSSLKTRIIQ